MRKDYKVVTYVVLALIILPSALIGARAVRAKRWERGYARIEVGQSKQKVVDSLGEPSEIRRCGGHVYSDGRVTGECAETYLYRSFLEDWVVFIDKDGNVIGKSYNVSG